MCSHSFDVVVILVDRLCLSYANFDEYYCVVPNVAYDDDVILSTNRK